VKIGVSVKGLYLLASFNGT